MPVYLEGCPPHPEAWRAAEGPPRWRRTPGSGSPPASPGPPGSGSGAPPGRGRAAFPPGRPASAAGPGRSPSPPEGPPPSPVWGPAGAREAAPVPAGVPAPAALVAGRAVPAVEALENPAAQVRAAPSSTTPPAASACCEEVQHGLHHHRGAGHERQHLQNHPARQAVPDSLHMERHRRILDLRPLRRPWSAPACRGKDCTAVPAQPVLWDAGASCGRVRSTYREGKYRTC